MEEEGPGYCHFPRDEGRGYDEEYFKGLTSEKQILVYKKGRPLYEWKVKDNEHKRNEPLDCRNYASAAIEISGLPLKAPEKKQGKQTGTAQRRRRGRRTNGGIL